MADSFASRREPAASPPARWKASLPSFGSPPLRVRLKEPILLKAEEASSAAALALEETRENVAELTREKAPDGARERLADCSLAVDWTREIAFFSFFSAMKRASFSLVFNSSPASCFFSAAIKLLLNPNIGFWVGRGVGGVPLQE